MHWLFGDQPGPDFLEPGEDGPGRDTPRLMTEARSAFRRRRFHRAEAHHVLSAMRHRAAGPGDRVTHVRAGTYRDDDLGRAAGGRPVGVHRPTSHVALRLVRSFPRVAVGPARGFLVPKADFAQWTDGHCAKRRQEDFPRRVRRGHDLLNADVRQQGHAPNDTLPSATWRRWPGEVTSVGHRRATGRNQCIRTGAPGGSTAVRMTESEKGLRMPGLPPAVAPPADHVDELLTASEATEAAGAVLRQILDERLRECRAVDPVFARELATRLAALVGRGGKRLRTAFAHCGWRAAGGTGDATAVLRTGAALELLQACALVHDDVMDGSVRRRGGAALHVELARAHWAAGMRGSAEAFGTSAAVLAGDLALAWADDLLTETALGTPHGRRLHEEWRAMRTEMVAGQYRDLHAEAARSSGVDEALAIATLKSALYTVARPLALGASLAGADAYVVEALRAAGRCAGLAFQLRDDLLGAFGDPARTGKPADDDLRSRKLTYLLAVALRLADATDDHLAAATLAPDADPRSEHAVRRVRAALERTGARDLVEAKIEELAETGLGHFERAGAHPAVRREFAALVERATGVAAHRTEEVA